MKRILLVKLSAIGDCLHATPALSALRQTYPDAEIGWVIHRHCLPVIEGNPALTRIHVWDRARFWPDFFRAATEIRSCRYDVAIDLQGLLKSAFLTRMSGAKETWGPSENREGSVWLYRNRTPDQRRQHILDVYLNRVAAIGAKWEAPPPMLFPLPPGAVDSVKAKLDLGDRRPRIVLNPSAGKPIKQWDPQHFAEVAAQFPDAEFLITGAPSDQALGGAIVEALHPETHFVNLVGRSTLPELAAVLSQCDLFIGGDTGPMHMAQAVGCPVVALFGPTRPEILGPRGLPHRIVDGHGSMDGVRVEAVVDAVRASLNNMTAS